MNQGKGSKQSFFEKKDQKTFLTWLRQRYPLLPGTSLGAGLRKKVFCFFFFKKEDLAFIGL